VGECKPLVSGAFERSIALHRTTYTHVLQTRGWYGLNPNP